MAIELSTDLARRLFSREFYVPAHKLPENVEVGIRVKGGVKVKSLKELLGMDNAAFSRAMSRPPKANIEGVTYLIHRDEQQFDPENFSRELEFKKGLDYRVDPDLPMLHYRTIRDTLAIEYLRRGVNLHPLKFDRMFYNDIYTDSPRKAPMDVHENELSVRDLYSELIYFTMDDPAHSLECAYNTIRSVRNDIRSSKSRLVCEISAIALFELRLMVYAA